MKAQLRVLEEGKAQLNRDITELQRKITESEKKQDNLRKELEDTRRRLGEETHEKEAYHQSNDELRALIKKSEAEKTEAKRVSEEVKKRLAGWHLVSLPLSPAFICHGRSKPLLFSIG